MPAPRTLARARATVAPLVAIILGLAAIQASGVVTASGASSATVVTMDVPTATQLTNGCTATAAASFGTIQPDTRGVTATAPGSVCRFTFASSNATAQLRVRQADGQGTAMSRGGSMTTSANARRLIEAVSIEPGNPAVAWAVDFWGGISRTANSGATWTQMGAEPLSVVGDGCGSVRAVSTTTVWVGCSNGKVARTVNTGASWTLAGTSPTTAGVNALGSASAAAAVIGTDTGDVYWTSTSGGTWTPATGLPTGPNRFVIDIDMVDASNGYLMVNPAHRVFRTADGGASWTELTSAGYVGSCFALDAVSTTVAWVACDGGRVERTTTGTSMASVSTPGLASPYLGITATSASIAVIVGEDGTIARTSTGGASWIDETGVTATDLRSVAMSGSQVYAVAWGDLIIGSGDAGDTWAVQRSNPAGTTLLDVDMADGLVAYAVGERGRIARTGDGGATWSAQVSGTGVHLRGVEAISATTAVAVGDGGTVLRTTNSGGTWAPVTSNASGADLRAVTGDVAGTTLLAAGTGGVAVRSEDGGATWVAARGPANGNVTLRGATILGGGNMYLVGSGRTVERSTDGGRTWAPLATPPLANGTILTTITGSHDGTTLLVGSYATSGIVRSVDSGATWTTAAGTLSGDRVSSLEFHGNGVLTGAEHNSSLSSSDLGTSAPDYAYVDEHITGYAAVDPQRSIGVGQGGAIRYTTVANPISDYGGGNTWGSGSATSMFGVCLQAVGGSALADWTVDATNLSGTCEALDTDPWRAVTTTSSLAAHTASIGASGTADLVWGMRSAASSPAGTYRAKVLVEVLGV